MSICSTTSSWVEVHHHQVERLDLHAGERFHVRRYTAVSEDAAVHARVQRLHAAVQHLG
jgi:hypothetical protein